MAPKIVRYKSFEVNPLFVSKFGTLCVINIIPINFTK